MNRPYPKMIVLFTLFCLCAFLRYQFVRAMDMATCDCLWSSAESGDVHTVLDKLDEGADPNCQNGEPLKRALQNQHRAIVFLLRHYGAKD